MKTIAVTGGIGSGKSAVCGILSSRGIPVYDCDSAAKRLYDCDPSLLDAIEDRLECKVRTADGCLDRKVLASIIFASSEKLHLLESIVHPAVLEDYLRWNRSQQMNFTEGSYDPSIFFGNEPFAIMESAVILSLPDFLSHVSKVVLVDAPEQTRILRACMRDKASAEAVASRVALQSFDLSKVDFTIDNSGSFDDLKSAVEDTFLRIIL